MDDNMHWEKNIVYETFFNFIANRKKLKLCKSLLCKHFYRARFPIIRIVDDRRYSVTGEITMHF